MGPKGYPCPSDINCQGRVFPQTIDYTFNSNGNEITVPQVTVDVCDRCGEMFFPHEAARKIEIYQHYSEDVHLHFSPEIQAKLTNLAHKHHRSLNEEVKTMVEQHLCQVE